jgi:hypothetical protein
MSDGIWYFSTLFQEDLYQFTFPGSIRINVLEDAAEGFRISYALTSPLCERSVTIISAGAMTIPSMAIYDGEMTFDNRTCTRWTDPQNNGSYWCTTSVLNGTFIVPMVVNDTDGDMTIYDPLSFQNGTDTYSLNTFISPPYCVKCASTPSTCSDPFKLLQSVSPSSSSIAPDPIESPTSEPSPPVMEPSPPAVSSVEVPELEIPSPENPDPQSQPPSPPVQEDPSPDSTETPTVATPKVTPASTPAQASTTSPMDTKIEPAPLFNSVAIGLAILSAILLALLIAAGIYITRLRARMSDQYQLITALDAVDEF